MDEPIANSSQFVLPMTTAPAASRRVTTVASYGGTKDSSMRDEAVVRTPRVQRLSLSATGTPTSGASRHRVEVAIDGGRPCERAVAGHGVERVERRLDGVQAGERVAAHVRRGAGTGAHGRADVSDGRPIAHPGIIRSPAAP